MEDGRQSWRVAYPLREVLFLVVCATIANCDDYEDIVDWGEANLEFLRGFSRLPLRHALRRLVSIADEQGRPRAFRALSSLGRRVLAGAVWTWLRLTVRPPGAATTRGTARDRFTWSRLTPPTPAWSWPRRPSTRRRTRSSSSPSCWINWSLRARLSPSTPSPAIPAIAQAIIEAGADYLLAVKENQPTLRAEVDSYFASAPQRGARHRPEPRQGPWPLGDPHA